MSDMDPPAAQRTGKICRLTRTLQALYNLKVIAVIILEVFTYENDFSAQKEA
jgi:hypothetical protein